MTKQPFINEQFQFPWPLVCDIACKAMIQGRDFERQVEFMTQDGMVKFEAKRARYLTMKKTNREAK